MKPCLLKDIDFCVPTRTNGEGVHYILDTMMMVDMAHRPSDKFTVQIYIAKNSIAHYLIARSHS